MKYETRKCGVVWTLLTLQNRSPQDAECQIVKILLQNAMRQCQPRCMFNFSNSLPLMHHLHALQFRSNVLLQHPLVFCHHLLATLLSQAVVNQVLQVSRYVCSRLELLGAAIHGTSKAHIPVSRHVAFEVMLPSTRRATNVTEKRLFV